jgi:serine/threonine protein kinase
LDYSNYKGPVVEAIGAEEFSVIPMKFRFIDSWSSSQYLTPAALMVFSYVADMIADDDASNVQKFVNLVLREIPVTPSSASSRTRPSTSTTDPSLLSAVSGSGNEMDLFSTFMVDDMNKPSDKFLTLQKGTEYSGHLNNVYQFETEQFESMFKCQISEDSKEVVLKVLDREQAKSLFRAEMADSPFEVDHEDSDKYYRTLRDKYHFPEIEVLHIIMHHNQMNKGAPERIINSPRLLLHGEIDLIKGLSSSKYIWSHEAQGNFMLISSIEDDIENLNSDTFKDGVRQLKLLSEIGVFHRDIKRGNLRFSAVGKLSFIDFSHVWLLKKDESPECCFNLMRAKLYQVLKDLGVEGLDL